MKLIINIFISSLIVVCWLLVFTLPVLAVAEPDSTPTIANFRVNRNLLTDGDALIYGEYDLPYGSLPTETADDTYIFKLEDDGNVIGLLTPFPYFDRGYNEGCFAFYVLSGVSWSVSYPNLSVSISQNPVHFDSPDSWSYDVPASAYSSQTTQAGNQSELVINIISIAERLESHHTSYTLLEPSPGGTILSAPAGENYFRGAIYGVQAMATDLFLVQVMDMGVTDRTWTTDQWDTYTTRLHGTWAGYSVNVTASQFNFTQPMTMSLIFVLPICLSAIVLSAISFRKVEPGYVTALVVMTGALLMGWFPHAIYATILQLSAIYIAYLWHYSRG